MLDTTNCQEYFDEIVRTAKAAGLQDKLQETLDYLDNYGGKDKTKCLLYKDWAPLSFRFTMQKKNESGAFEHWFIGGVIFHGPHDGYGDGGMPTLSVSLNNSQESRWEVHT